MKARICTASLIALTGAQEATAQSSVSVFGTMDLNATYTRAGGTSRKSMDQGGNILPSRLGFRGGARYTGARVGYANGPLDVAVAYGQTPTAGETLKVANATYSHIRNRGNASYVTSDSSPAAPPGGNASGLQAGFSHNF